MKHSPSPAAVASRVVSIRQDVAAASDRVLADALLGTLREDDLEALVHTLRSHADRLVRDLGLGQ